MNINFFSIIISPRLPLAAMYEIEFFDMYVVENQ